jgi:hypothetical protein
MNATQLLRVALFSLLGSVGTFTPSHASMRPILVSPACGDILWPGGFYVLTADLLNCADVALSILGLVEVDLNGHTVSCRGNPDLNNSTGIFVQGYKAHVYNGTVAECRVNVAVHGTGFHHVNNIVSDSSAGGGIFGITCCTGPHNHIDHNTAIGSETNTPGFVILSTDSWYDHNAATGYDIGFLITDDGSTGGSRNHLTHNTAEANTTAGSEVGRFQGTEKDDNFELNTASDSRYGFIDEGDSSRFRANIAKFDLFGFLIADAAKHDVRW